LPRLQDWADDPDFGFSVEGGEAVGSFVCFVVAPGRRGRGVAGPLTIVRKRLREPDVAP
jgi:hypothetical protein